MSKDVQSLYVTVLKNISKQPVKYGSETCYKRAFSAQNMELIGKLNVDVVQSLVDYITEAGRLTDDIVPARLFANKSTLSLRNSKISGEEFY